ncbi:extracellular solute-binding protein [Candidatus Cryosericum terrychapinii]|jgi:multiple sugar transport system substrate-binding protein|nr:extracellular solute-binding protein [Candidatus Cryosericum terrychapinii]
MLNVRRLLAVVLVLLIAFTSVLATVPSAKAETITTIEVYIGKNTGTVNGKATTLEQGALIKSGRTLVPLRFITEAMGATLVWDAVTRTANITLAGNKIALTIDKTVAKVNGYDVTLDAPAAIINSKTVVPMRFVAESMGAIIAWNATLKKVTVQFSMDWLKNKAIVPFWEAMAAALGTSLKGLTDEFNATHPSMEVQLVQMANYTTLQTKTIGAIAAKDPPLIAQAYENWAAQYATGFYLSTFDSYINGSNGLSKAEIADFFPKMWDSSKLADGKRYMMPFNKSNVVLYYNKDMFKAAGITRAPTTWQEFADDCAKLNKVDDKGDQIQWGASHTPSVDLWYGLVYAYGGRVLNDTYDQVLFANNNGVKAGTQLFADLFAKKYMHYTTAYGDQTDLGVGKAGMTFGSVAGRTYYEQAIAGKFELGEAPLPAGPAGEAAALYGTNIVMFGNAPKYTQRQKDAAWAYIKWFTSPHTQAVWAAQTGYMPARQSSLKDPVLIAAYAAKPETRAGLEQLSGSVLEPPTGGWNDARNKITTNLQNIFLGKVTVADGLKKMAQDVQAVIHK